MIQDTVKKFEKPRWNNSQSAKFHGAFSILIKLLD